MGERGERTVRRMSYGVSRLGYAFRELGGKAKGRNRLEAFDGNVMPDLPSLKGRRKSNRLASR